MPFVIVQALVCQRSRLFKAAYSEPGIHDKAIHLPGTEVAVFQAYCDYLYSGKLSVATAAPQNGNDRREIQTMLLKLRLLGDVLDDLEFRNMTTRAYLKFISCSETFSLRPDIFQRVWTSIKQGSLLRKLLMDATLAALATFSTDPVSERFFYHFPREVLEDFTLAAVRRLGPLGSAIVNLQTINENVQQYLEPEEP